MDTALWLVEIDMARFVLYSSADMDKFETTEIMFVFSIVEILSVDMAMFEFRDILSWNIFVYHKILKSTIWGDCHVMIFNDSIRQFHLKISI